MHIHIRTHTKTNIYICIYAPGAAAAALGREGPVGRQRHGRRRTGIQYTCTCNVHAVYIQYTYMGDNNQTYVHCMLRAMCCVRCAVRCCNAHAMPCPCHAHAMPCRAMPMPMPMPVPMHTQACAEGCGVDVRRVSVNAGHCPQAEPLRHQLETPLTHNVRYLVLTPLTARYLVNSLSTYKTYPRIIYPLCSGRGAARGERWTARLCRGAGRVTFRSCYGTRWCESRRLCNVLGVGCFTDHTLRRTRGACLA